MIDLDGLRADGSWQLTWSGDRLDEAVFWPAPDTAAARGDLVARLGTDSSDPERWEAALIDTLLTDPVSAGLRRLELHLTDFHHSAHRAVRALAAHRREQLASLYFGHEFRLLYEHSRTSTGGRIDPLERLHEGFADEGRTGMWAALPALLELTAEGGLLFDDIDSGSLRHLRLRGALFADGSVFPARAPALESLELEIRSDVFGTACPVEQLEELDPAGLPSLRQLDLGSCEFDAGDLGTLRTLAGAAILPQLAELVLPGLRIEADEFDGDPLAELAELAPAFAHLALSVADVVDVEGVEDAEVERLFGLE
ncbi:hypothetical protein KZZ52_44915 [Dactylosporangium sp. AC04546]|uniref:hypothetical protein n=1 Tax=Dactylosporangium sp. AC04546 TaxID=2862460 RepID=UPI001EDD657D|nr:hypothetical protein [Dactylosporangium sp. AC04546]WVK81059.1 hypothetical protein KZZ52_44915 [Dactylosporangium sp. AC04546]